MKHILSTNESFTIKKGNLEKDVLEELNKISSKIDYKSYSSYQAMVADDPANGTIGWDGNEEIFYIYDEGNCDWRRIDNNIVSSITSGSSNAVTGGAIYSALAGKTGNIWYNSYNDMIADSPANGTIGFESDYEHFYIYDSANAEWKQIDQSEDGGIPIITIQTTGNVSQSLSPNTFYKFGSIDSLTITLVAGNNLSIYAGKFTASSNWGGVGLNLPVTVEEAANNDTIEASKTYEFNILDGIILVKEVA